MFRAIFTIPTICSLAQIVKIAISLSVLFTIGLAYFVPINILWSLIQKRMAEKSLLSRRLAEISLRLGGMLAMSKRIT
jgi:hypothetical protein